MNDEKLIECVRQYQFLYDLNHPKYMDCDRKEVTWQGIARQIGQPPAACKQRWQSLRDGFRRALNKRKLKSGETKSKCKKWKYEEEMTFVAPYFAYRKKDTDGLSDDDDDDEEKYYEQSGPAEQKNNFYNEMGNSEPEYKVTPITQNATSVLIAQLLEERKLKQEKHDELDKFFLSIAETCKKFSPYMQAVAKKKIFTLVSEMEIQHLTPDPSSYPTEVNDELREEIPQTQSIIKQETVDVTPSYNT